MEKKSNSIAEFRHEIKTQVLGDKEVFAALAQNTFKGLEQKNIPAAILDGRMRGFTLQDFMTKNVYALPFWNNKDKKQDYSLVASISHARKVAMRSGQSGKSAPSFTTFENGKIETCSVTVWKKDGDDRGYTATVYFDEYEKPPTTYKDSGKTIPGMWQLKPRTMIAKVAEMHALRMAFPEQMSEMFVEEEFERTHAIHVEAVDVVDPEIKKSAIESIKKQTKLDELQKFFTALDSDLRKDDDVIDAYNDIKNLIETEAKPAKPAPKAK